MSPLFRPAHKSRHAVIPIGTGGFDPGGKSETPGSIADDLSGIKIASVAPVFAHGQGGGDTGNDFIVSIGSSAVSIDFDLIGRQPGELDFDRNFDPVTDVKLIEFAIGRGYIKPLDTEAMSYAIWCFIRGYNADALGRGMPKDEAVKNFRYSFAILLNGMKA